MTKLLVLVLLGQGTVTELPRDPVHVADPIAALLDPASAYPAMYAALEALDSSPVPDGAADRLRAGLEEELRQPRLRRLPDASDCEREERSDACDIGISPCLPRAAFLAVALGKTGHLRESAGPVKALLARGDPLSSRVAAAALANVEPAAVVDLNRARLKGADPFCRENALKALGPYLERPGLLPDWLAALRGGRGDERALFAKAVAGIPQAVPVFVEWLQVEDVETLQVILPALAARPRPADAVVERVAALAERHWSARVREAAAQAARRWGRETKKVAPRPAKAPPPLDSPKLRSEHTGPCSAVPGGEDETFAVPLEQVCVVGINRGEWGGALRLYLRGRVVIDDDAWWRNPRAVTRLGKRILVLEGLQHLGGSAGRITEIKHEGDAWRFEVLAELPGAVVAWGLDPGGDLILHTARPSGGDSECQDEQGRPADCVMRFSQGGVVSAY